MRGKVKVEKSRKICKGDWAGTASVGGARTQWYPLSNFLVRRPGAWNTKTNSVSKAPVIIETVLHKRVTQPRFHGQQG